MFARTMGLAVVVAAAAFAPARLSAQMEFGLKAGGSFGNISNKGALPGDLKTRTGFAAGVSLGARARVIGIGAEALFAQRGLDADDGDGPKINYFDIPVYVKVQVPTPGLSPFAYAGPQVSFEISCKVGDTDCDDGDRSKTDYAGIIGAGLKIGNEQKFGFTVEARYIYGLKDLKVATVTDEDSFKTRSFMILVGMLF